MAITTLNQESQVCMVTGGTSFPSLCRPPSSDTLPPFLVSTFPGANVIIKSSLDTVDLHNYRIIPNISCVRNIIIYWNNDGVREVDKL